MPVPITSDLDGYQLFWNHRLWIVGLCAAAWGVSVLALLAGIWYRVSTRP